MKKCQSHHVSEERQPDPKDILVYNQFGRGYRVGSPVALLNSLGFGLAADGDRPVHISHCEAPELYIFQQREDGASRQRQQGWPGVGNSIADQCL